MYGSAQAAIYQAVHLPRLGWRRDQPPPAVGQRQAPQVREHEEAWDRGDAPQPLQDNRNRVNQVVNQGDQGLRAGVAHAPQNRKEDSSMELQQEFSHVPRGTRRVETVRATGNMSSDDETDFQQLTEEENPSTKENTEPEVKAEKKEKDTSTEDKKEQNDTQSSDRNEPVSNVPSVQTDVKTLGANQGNEVSINLFFFIPHLDNLPKYIYIYIYIYYLFERSLFCSSRQNLFH